MLLKPNTKIRKWLILLFVASFLVNVQASVDCAMMPDMAEQHTECCCGLSHRSTLSSDTEDTQSPLKLANTHSEQNQECGDPRIGCCMLEVSVGLHDPPAGDKDLPVLSKNINHHKTINNLDDNPTVIEFHVSETPTQFTSSKFATVLIDSFLHPPSPPLYKITERYRI